MYNYKPHIIKHNTELLQTDISLVKDYRSMFVPL